LVVHLAFGLIENFSTECYCLIKNPALAMPVAYQ
jgi:hypothetical protein